MPYPGVHSWACPGQCTKGYDTVELGNERKRSVIGISPEGRDEAYRGLGNASVIAIRRASETVAAWSGGGGGATTIHREILPT